MAPVDLLEGVRSVASATINSLMSAKLPHIQKVITLLLVCAAKPPEKKEISQREELRGGGGSPGWMCAQGLIRNLLVLT